MRQGWCDFHKKIFHLYITKTKNTLFLLLLLNFLVSNTWSHTESNPINDKPLPTALVLSPILKNSYYRTIFQDIINGINEASTEIVDIIYLTSDFSATDINDTIRKYNPDFIISLGSKGKDISYHINKQTPVILSAVLSPPGKSSNSSLDVTYRIPNATVSLTPDPSQIYTHINLLLPTVKRVHVVFHRNDQLFINKAQQLIDHYGLILHTYEAKHLQDSARIHKTIMTKFIDQEDALWLLQSPKIVDNHIILPSVLKKAWQYNFPVISNNISHVQHGALFSLYPDNYQLGNYLWHKGKAIASSSSNTLDSKDNNQLQTEWLKQTRLAINTRTAMHLGLKFNRDQQRQFDLILPRR